MKGLLKVTWVRARVNRRKWQNIMNTNMVSKIQMAERDHIVMKMAIVVLS
jgi:hypothetical protein